MLYPILGVIVLVLDIIAIVSIVSSGAVVSTKLLWIALVLLLPVVGMALYFIIGPGHASLPSF